MEILADRVRRLEPRNICIIKPSSLGDVIHCLPILPSLRALFPNAQISWVVNAAFRSLLDNHPSVDHVIAYERGKSGISSRGASSTVELCARLMKERYDLTIDLQGLLRSGLMTAATRAKVRVGIADAREGARWFYTHRVTAPRLGLHAVDRVGRVMAALGLKEFQPEFHISPAAQDQAWARETLAPVASPRLILNLGARWMTKRWPPEHFAEIARRAVSEFGAGLICVGAIVDTPLAAELQRAIAPLAAPRSERQDHAPPACRAGPAIPGLLVQRYRSAASGCRGGSVGRGHLYLYGSSADRPVRSTRDHRAELRLVRTQFSEDLQPARMLCRAQSRPGMAGGAPAPERVAGIRRIAQIDPMSPNNAKARSV